MKKLLFTFSILAILVSCKQEKKPNAKNIINKTIEASGGTKFEVSTISFNFRDKHYKAIRNNGMFELSREFKDSINVIKDILSNKGFQRFVNNEAVVIEDSMAIKYTNSVNSVHYFSVLPFGLNDKAVNKTLLNKVLINGNEYYKIKVTFSEKDGGEDFEDVFVYWIDTDTFKTEFIAYSYLTEGGGMRFREAYNERYVNGIRFVDYNNYKPLTKDVNLLDLDRLFEKGELKLLSKIENINIEVK